VSEIDIEPFREAYCCCWLSFADKCWVWDSYEHHSIDEPAILLGGAFMVDLPGMSTLQVFAPWFKVVANSCVEEPTQS
jgi:hypothetical protein